MVYTACHSVYILWTHYYTVKQHYSNFRIIKAIFYVHMFGLFTVLKEKPLLAWQWFSLTVKHNDRGLDLRHLLLGDEIRN